MSELSTGFLIGFGLGLTTLLLYDIFIAPTVNRLVEKVVYKLFGDKK